MPFMCSPKTAMCPKISIHSHAAQMNPQIDKGDPKSTLIIYEYLSEINAIDSLEMASLNANFEPQVLRFSLYTSLRQKTFLKTSGKPLEEI